MTVVGSRLLGFAAGAAGARTAWVTGWSAFDPQRITAGLGPVGNLLAGASVRWDALHYLWIAQSGYRHAGDTVFFPLYPLLVHAAAWLTGSDVRAGIIVSLGALAVALTLLHRLTTLELGRRAADATVLLIAFAPLSFFFSALYTESLFLALSVGAVYAARRDRWAVACLLAALAAVTRAWRASSRSPC